MALKHHVLTGFLLIVLSNCSTATGMDERDAVIVVESMTTVLIQHAEIPARDAGVLQSVAVRTGQRVEKGELLVSLDDDLQRLAVRKAELNMRIAELKANNSLPIDTAVAQVREAEQEKARLEIAAKISRNQADSDVSVRLAEKAREVAQFELDRARKAREAFSGSISNAELNRLQVLFDQRTLEIEKAREDKDVTSLKAEAEAAAVLQQAETVERNRLLAAEREQEQQVARTSLDVARSELELAQLDLERRRLYAPFAATIVNISRQPGEWVEPGAVVLRMIQLDELRVEGFVSAEQASAIKPGAEADIQFPGTRLKAVTGRITFVSPEIDPVNQQVRIWADFPNADHSLRPGLVARMEVAANGNPSAGSTTEPRASADQAKP